jgi:hypothetical protein
VAHHGRAGQAHSRAEAVAVARRPAESEQCTARLSTKYVEKYYEKYYQKFFKVKEAHAADVRSFAATRAPQDTTKPPAAKTAPVPPQRPNSVFVIVGSQYMKVPDRQNSAWGRLSGGRCSAGHADARAARWCAAADEQPHPVSRAKCGSGSGGHSPSARRSASATVAKPDSVISPQNIELQDARMRIEQARHEHNRYGVEIQKKFSLAAGVHRPRAGGRARSRFAFRPAAWVSCSA